MRPSGDSWCTVSTGVHGEDTAREALAAAVRAEGRTVAPPTLHASYAL